MRTEELIALIAEDAPAGPPLGVRLRRGLVLGIAGSILILLATIGIRPDLMAALGSPRVVFKLGFTLLLAASACGLVFRVGVPGLSVRSRARLLILPVLLLLAGLTVELAVLPAGAWGASLVGRNAAFCLFFIPVLSLVPLAGLLWALRSGAPESPGLAGAATGLAAGSVAAAIYAWHCPDDSPLFVATWYGLAIVGVAAAGFCIGRRWLRW